MTKKLYSEDVSNRNGDSMLEPRVAKLETGLEILTRDVATLAQVTREQGINIEKQIQQLAVGVTQASGPRKTDWSVIISALFLVMAISSAVFWPLNQTSQNNKVEVQALEQKISDHFKLPLHPVGQARIDQMQKTLDDTIFTSQHDLDALDKKLQKEIELITSEIKTQINAISAKYDKEISDLGNRLIARVNEYDSTILESNKRDLEELRWWRMRAMNGDIKGATPIVISPTP